MLLNAILRNDFESFVRRCMLTLNPGAPFLTNWHIDAIAYRLEQIRNGEVTRLIINLPPRYLKSILVSVAFPAFLLGHDPRRRIFAISYGGELAEKHAANSRWIMQSPWYLDAFPDMRIARSTADEVITTARGFRKSTSIGGALTGLGGDTFIIDDPLKPKDAQSDTQRNALNDWVGQTLMSRLDDKKKGAIIVVMQRVHLDDLSGFLTENSDDWTVLSLPAIAETEEQIPIGKRRYYRRKVGEALHPQRESIETLEAIRRDVGTEIFSAQYQQCPVPPGGAMIKRHWPKYYDSPPERTHRARIIQSWDTAAKDGPLNAFSVCTTWMLVEGKYYLLDLIRERFEYPELLRQAVLVANRYKPHAILIEDASTGIPLAQELRRAGLFPIKMIPVEHAKEVRMWAETAKFEAGLVFFPAGAAFLPVLEAELFSFPQSKTNDQVDSISQALAWKPSFFSYDNVR